MCTAFLCPLCPLSSVHSTCTHARIHPPSYTPNLTTPTPKTPPTHTDAAAASAFALHKDVYEVLLYAVEHSTASTNDREKIAKLWRDFFKVGGSLIYG